jgi:hypothetical protein
MEGNGFMYNYKDSEKEREKEERKGGKISLFIYKTIATG